ncbi:FAD-dependent oxidoreductase [Methylobacterium segetis]|uniref:FAD-dependent oxidoreductase n=1 Tax=Methylobacterium segetis TaxID=2488750 RepID=UPI0010460C98|nr:FAD-dependent oxidoreductase [Methylobacterium segetis]
MFEKNDRILDEASGNNQFRLHLGFHYPRHAGTRIQSRDGFSRFLERYSDLSRKISENIYAVPKYTSLIDFETYKLIMTATGIPYHTVDRCPLDLQEIEGLIRVDERILMIEKARNYFSHHLGPSLSLSDPVTTLIDRETHIEVNGEKFDYVVDATWGHLLRADFDVFYEPTVLLYFEASPNLPAITFVDGPLYSIYPTEEPKIYTLSSVPHTPLGRYYSAEEARTARDRVDTATIRAKLKVMTEQAQENVRNFPDLYKFIGPQISIKTKLSGSSDDRSCYVGRRGRLFTVLSGKIDTIFHATERILSDIEADSDTKPIDVPSSLLSRIQRKSIAIGLE